jgi:HlyD family secretion protein
VKYDTLIALPSVQGLMPGMSAEVEVVLDRYENVLSIPVAAVVETAQGDFCWIKTAEGIKRRSLQLGDTNDVFTVVEAGLKEGDEVVLNPFAIEEARILAAEPRDEAKPREAESTESPRPGIKSKSPGKTNKQKSKPQGVKSKQVDM